MVRVVKTVLVVTLACRCTIGFNGKHCDQGKMKQLGR